MTSVVILRLETPPTVAELGRPLAAALGLPLAEVTGALRRCRGILRLSRDDAEARRLAAFLSAAGHPCVLVPEGDLPALVPPRLVFDADPTASGLFLQRAATGWTGLRPWEGLVAVAVGHVTRSRLVFARPQEPADDGDSPFDLLDEPDDGAPPRPHKLREERVLGADFVFDRPPDRLRIGAGRFVHDWRGQEMALTSRANFIALLRETARHAPAAHFAPSVREALARGALDPPRFASEADFAAHVEWLAAWPRFFRRATEGPR